MPKRIKTAARRIPSKVYEATKREFARMMKYFYRVSNSDKTSPIVIAPKATALLCDSVVTIAFPIYGSLLATIRYLM